MHARLRPLARYQAQDAHEAWVGGLLLEGRLRTRIQVRRYTLIPYPPVVSHLNVL